MEQKSLKEQGVYRGIGIVSVVEGTLGLHYTLLVALQSALEMAAPCELNLMGLSRASQD